MRCARPARARLLYAASDTDPDILYPTGFFAPDPFLFVQARGKRGAGERSVGAIRCRDDREVEVARSLP